MNKQLLQHDVDSPRKAALPTRRHRKMRYRSSKRQRSIGTVIVEMAMCMPLMLLLVFGCLELNSSIFLSQTLTSAAHEGALVGLRQNATEAEVINRVNTIMTARNISGYTLEVQTLGTPFESLDSGEQFTVFIQAPRSGSYISLSNVSAQVTALRP